MSSHNDNFCGRCATPKRMTTDGARCHCPTKDKKRAKQKYPHLLPGKVEVR